MNISRLTPTWFSFLVVTYNLRDLESNPTTATNPSCGVGKWWYLTASVFHLTNVANAAFCTKYLQTAVPHVQCSALQQQEPGRCLGAERRLEMAVCHLGQSPGLPCLCSTWGTVPAGGFLAVCLPLVLAV